jgi:hypothetical protein
MTHAPIGRARRARSRRKDAGWTLAGTMVLVAVVTVALGQMVFTSAYGTLNARRSREHFSVRLVASEVLSRTPPAADGGSVYPEAAASGWSDVVMVDPSTGLVGPDDPKRAGARLLRQWKTSAGGSGRRVYAVSVVALDESGRPLAGADAATAVLARSVKGRGGTSGRAASASSS